MESNPVSIFVTALQSADPIKVPHNVRSYIETSSKAIHRLTCSSKAQTAILKPMNRIKGCAATSCRIDATMLSLRPRLQWEHSTIAYSLASSFAHPKVRSAEFEITEVKEQRLSAHAR